MARYALAIASVVLLAALMGCPPKPPTETAQPVVAQTPPKEPAGFSQGVIEVDEVAPEFTLKDTDGSPLTKADFTGQVLILDFWATWCEPCKVKLKEYEPIIARYKDQGIVLVAVSLDSAPDVAAGWGKETNCPYRIAMFDDAFKSAYFPEISGEVAIPQVRIIDRDGNLRFKFDARSEVADMDLALKELAQEKVGGDQAISKEIEAENRQ